MDKRINDTRVTRIMFMLNVHSQDLYLSGISTFHRSIDNERIYNDNMKAAMKLVSHEMINRL